MQFFAYVLYLAFIFSLLPSNFLACDDDDEASKASPLEPVFEVTLEKISLSHEKLIVFSQANWL